MPDKKFLTAELNGFGSKMAGLVYNNIIEPTAIDFIVAALGRYKQWRSQYW